MVKMSCVRQDMYPKDGICCDRCPAGEHVQVDCDGTTLTKCAKCAHGFYTATKNHLRNCQRCKECSSGNKQRKAKDCTATANTVCECETGFYCSNDLCDHCQPVTHCPAGAGVKVPATRTNDTVCAPCEDGTYSNVTDFLSPCKTHTRCDDFGRELRIQGTQTTNSVCSDFLPRCSWMLPAGLWSGLVLSVLVLFAVVVCWRAKKRKSWGAARSSVPVTLVEMFPTAPVTSLHLPLPSTERNGHCQESCVVDDCKLPIFDMDDDDDDNLVSCDMDSSLPITPLKASVSFTESNHNTGNAGHRPGNFLRAHSEPQEDEWCGT